MLALDVRTELYFAVNRAGALLWTLLARGTTRAELAERLAREYDLPPARAASDVDALLAELSARELLQEPGGGDT